MDYGTIFSPEFQAFINQFAQKKGNDLQFSNTFMPKRTQIITLDLTTARDESNPYEVKVPFNSVHCERMFITSSGVDTTGVVKISFDYGDIASISNCKRLNANDAFSVDKEVSKCFLTWTAQSRVSVQLAFMTDIDFKPGATQSTITSGSVSTTSASRYPAPSAIAINQSLNNGGNPVYTLAAGKYAWLTGFVLSGAAGQGYIEVSTDGGTTWYKLAYANYGAININQRVERTYLAAGAKIRCTTNAVSNEATAYIEVYDV